MSDLGPPSFYGGNSVVSVSLGALERHQHRRSERELFERSHRRPRTERLFEPTANDLMNEMDFVLSTIDQVMEREHGSRRP